MNCGKGSHVYNSHLKRGASTASHGPNITYPRDADGIPNKRKLRLCRGYLNSLDKWWGAAEPDQASQSEAKP